MKKLLILFPLLLASCAPLAQLAQPAEKANLTVDGQSVLLTNPGPDALTGDPSRTGDGPALVLSGVGLTPDATASQWCKANADKSRLNCNLPNVGAGTRLRVALTAGTLNDGSVWAYRASLGAKPVLIWLK